jgi:SET domain-containing protein
VDLGRIHHSCIPNARKEYIGDLLVLRATRPIKAGEEIFHAYDESPDYDERQQALNLTWGFRCDCALCRREDGRHCIAEGVKGVGESGKCVC